MFYLTYLHTTARKHGWTTNWFLCWFLLILLSTLQSATCYTNFIFSSSLPDILRRGECRSISTSYCLGVMAFYPLVTDPDNNSDIYLSGWTLVCTRHIQLSCIFPTTIIFLILALTMNCLHMTWDSTVKGSPPKEAKSSPLFTVSTTAGTNLLHTSYVVGLKRNEPTFHPRSSDLHPQPVISSERAKFHHFYRRYTSLRTCPLSFFCELYSGLSRVWLPTWESGGSHGTHVVSRLLA